MIDESGDSMKLSGTIFDIERFALHDGPGIRTTLFLKGCPLVCRWCHNPESISPRPQLVLLESKCISCEKCFDACPAGAHERLADGSRAYHRDKCSFCGRCVEVCPPQALVMEGRAITVEDALEELSRDAPFYCRSGGGITLSGGEPMQQVRFSAEVLRRCREKGMHTALDTSGYAPWDDFEKVLPFVNLILYDLKHADSGFHLSCTGVPNELILENLLRIDRTGASIEIRVPVVPGMNDSRENIEALSEISRRLRNLTGVQLLPYHGLGEAKYARLGRAYPLRGLQQPSRERMEEISSWFAPTGIRVTIAP
jgi:pyruvate formate lyase activating enzyme